MGLGAEPAAQHGREQGNNEDELANLGAKGSVISIFRLWLKHPFNICAHIALPTDSFKHLSYIAFIGIYP